MSDPASLADSEQPVKMVLRFDWGTVRPDVGRAMLAALYAADPKLKKRALELPDEMLTRQLSKSFGRTASGKGFDQVAKVVRDTWVPKARREELVPLVDLVAISLEGARRRELTRSAASCRQYLLDRNVTKNFAKNLRRAFVKAHKRPMPANSSSAGAPARASSGAISLVGQGLASGPSPYPHQRSAWQRMDDLLRDQNRFAGLMVLPTGSGKTYTTVSWLLRRASDAGVRVLWIADQQELVTQAAREFSKLAPRLPADASLRMRVIHGAAGLATTMADPELDVLCITRQSLMGAQFGAEKRARLRAFLDRPTVVVVDEAHHAVSATYQQLIAFILKARTDVSLLGLTATPWPSGYGRSKLLRDTFPDQIVAVTLSELVESGILARPTIHALSTGVTVSLDEDELRAMGAGDLPASVLRRLNVEARNGLVVRTWVEHQHRWDKTLIFACDIGHAESLAAEFRVNGVDTFVVHSQAEEHQTEVIKRFREFAGPAVLVSVGMLLEGVDLPDATTAFLVRPTRSRILMRQMVGRVLRGPSAGGAPVAHIVDLRDSWAQDLDILSPGDLPDLPPPDVTDPEGVEALPPILDEESGSEVPLDVLRRIEQAYLAAATASLDGSVLNSATLVGFYALDDLSVPVFEHAQDRWTALIRDGIRGQLTKRRAEKLFADLYAPRPTPPEVQAVADFCSSYLDAPPLRPIRVAFSLTSIVDDLMACPPMTAQERAAWMLKKYQSTLARTAFASFHRFREALSQEEASRFGGSSSAAVGLRPEEPRGTQVGADLPKLPRTRVDRPLEPLFNDVLLEGARLLASIGDPELRERLQVAHPRVAWTETPIPKTWAFWAPGTGRKRGGEPQIRVNRQLFTAPAVVSDELLKYLLWHELCHQLLPGQLHDAEFRELEARWPNAARLDFELDTLGERYDLGW